MGCEHALSVRRVATQCQHVLDAGAFVAAQIVTELVDRAVAAGEVCHGQQPRLVADPLDESNGTIVPAAAARTMGH